MEFCIKLHSNRDVDYEETTTTRRRTRTKIHHVIPNNAPLGGEILLDGTYVAPDGTAYGPGTNIQASLYLFLSRPNKW